LCVQVLLCACQGGDFVLELLRWPGVADAIGQLPDCQELQHAAAMLVG
jgi:hypothetical protein